MSEGIGAVLTFAIGVAISPVPIIAVILMLFSARATVNGLLFLLGWVVALSVVIGVAYALADAGDIATDSTAADSVAWGKIVIGVLFLLLALREWRSRPAPDSAPVPPKWMAGIDSFSPGKAFTIALLLSGLNPKNLLLSVGAGAALAQTGVFVDRRGRLADRLCHRRQHHDSCSRRVLPGGRRQRGRRSTP